MRKIYTNVIQFTLSLAMLMCVGNAATAQCDIPFPDNAVWGTQFDGGFDGWEALDGNFEERVDADGNNIGWEWHDASTIDSRIQDGAFAGSAQAFASESACNGAVLLNSDFLDNQGVPNFAQGDCPAICSSILRSPTIDLSGATGENFVLQMATQHRQFTSAYTVLISTDDGVTWGDSVTVFPDGDLEALVNSPHLFNDQFRVPLCGLTNSSTVRLAILYDANYYYWILDDIYILEETEADLRVNQNWFAVPVTYGTPADQAFPLAFLADISNQSPVSSDGSVLNVTIEQNGDVVHEQSLDYEAIDGCAINENRVFPELYEPTPNAGDVYTLTYEIVNSNADADASNNTATATFEYTDGEYVKVIPESITGGTYRDSRFGAETVVQSFGSGFYVKNGTNDNGEQYVVTNVLVGLESGELDADPLVSGTVEVTVYEWFDIDMDGEVDGDPANEKVKVGTVTVLTDLVENERAIMVQPLTEDGEPIALKDNTQYIVMAHFNPFDGMTYYHTVYSPSELNRNYHDGPMEFAFGELAAELGDNISARVGTLGAVDGVTHDDRDGARNFIPVFWGTSMINVSLGIISSSEDINEAIGIDVYPNPASQVVFADISLEASSDVTVQVVDVTGKLMLTQNFSNVQSDKLQINIDALADGIYVMNVRTDEGVNTQKFTVQNSK